MEDLICQVLSHSEPIYTLKVSIKKKSIIFLAMNVF